MIKSIIMIFAGFVAGRYSYLVHRNRYLDSKKKELISYHEQLIAIELELEAKDKHIRRKWQGMVDDFSKYQSAVAPDDTGKWTDMDDIYLRSWSSAEE